MPRFAANLSMMYPEHAFLDRFAAAARDGFKGVEYLFPYEYDAGELAARLREHGLTQTLFNAPPGDWAQGERGIAILPGREDEFRRGIDTAIRYALALGNTTIHVMAGVVAPDGDRARHRATYLGNLAHAALAAAGHALTVVIEPINTRNMPGYFLNRQDEAHQVLREVGAPNLKVQFDLYHAQIVEGDLAVKLRQYMPDVGHIQVASVPERHEPDEGEVNFAYLMKLVDTLGYKGWVGGEYNPRGKTSDGLGWFKAWS